MKIRCPICKTSYQVNIPNLTEKGVAVECAKCHNKFLVKPEPQVPPPSPKPEEVESPPPTPVQKEEAPEIKVAPTTESPMTAESDDAFDNFLDQLIQKETEQATPAEKEAKTPVSQAGDLDSFMTDDFFADAVEAPVSQPTEPQKSIVSPEKTVVTDQDDNLDNLLDNLMGDDLFADTTGAQVDQPAEPKKSMSSPEKTIVADQADNLDNLLDSLMGDELSTSTTEEVVSAKTMDDAAMDSIWEQAVAEGAATPEPVKAVAKEDDIWAQAFADQENLNKKTEGADTNTETTATAVMEEGVKIDEDPWAQAFADQAKTEAAAATAAAPAEGASDEDLWAQAFADQEKTEAAAATVAAPAEGASDEDLWAQAFADQEKTEAAATKTEESPAVEEKEETTATATVEDELEEAKKELLDDEEVGASDYDLEEGKTGGADTGAKKKFLGFISLPATKTGKLVLTGSLVALIVAGGGGYFAYKTLMPVELAEVHEVKKIQGEKKAETKKESDVKTEQTETAGKPEETKQADEKSVKEPETAKTAKEPEVAKSTKEPESASPGKSDEKTEPETAALPLERNVVTLSTIMPVAFNANEIRVLSFTMEVEMSNEETTKAVQTALPLYEKITVATVEEFLQRKFYNDILYVREKLQKKMELAFNKKIQGGKANRVKRIKFKEFSVQ